MEILGLGVDLVDVARVRSADGTPGTTFTSACSRRRRSRTASGRRTRRSPTPRGGPRARPAARRWAGCGACGGTTCASPGRRAARRAWCWRARRAERARVARGHEVKVALTHERTMAAAFCVRGASADAARSSPPTRRPRSIARAPSGGVSVASLMERPASRWRGRPRVVAGGAYGRRAVVVCGKGNNGGDGLVAARRLRPPGMGVTVVLLGGPRGFRGAAAANFRRLRRRRTFAWVPRRTALGRELARADVAVDAMFGTGFHGPRRRAALGRRSARCAASAARSWPSTSRPASTGRPGRSRRPAVRAAVTVTFGALKPGVVFLPGAELAGRRRGRGHRVPAGPGRAATLRWSSRPTSRRWLPSAAAGRAQAIDRASSSWSRGRATCPAPRRWPRGRPTGPAPAW